MPLGFWVLASVYIHLSGVLRERAANMTLRCVEQTAAENLHDRRPKGEACFCYV
jgi:hypothetical protein